MQETARSAPRAITVKELAQMSHSELVYCTYLLNAYLEALDLDIEMEDQLLPRVLQMLDHLERAHRKLKGLEQHYRNRLGT